MSKKTVAIKNPAENVLSIGGRTYTLEWDFNAFARVQAELGINLLSDEEDFSPLRLRARLWAALLPLHPDTTVEDAGKLISPKSMASVMKATNSLWSTSEERQTEGDAQP